MSIRMMQMRNGIVRAVVSVSAMCAASVAVAQGTAASAATTQSDSALYAKAQQLVSNGDGKEGRAIVDSLMGVAQQGTPRYAEALYWRAVLAASPSDAERSYRQIIVDYPMSPRIDDALLRIGQLEITRGDREAALQHFQRLTVEHADSPLRAKASYWLARAYLEKNDLKHACTANADALAHARASDVELRNQIEFQNQRCAGVSVPTEIAASGEKAGAAGEPAPAESVATASDERVEEAPKPVPAAKPVKGKAPVAKPVAKPAPKSVKPAKPAVTETAAEASAEASDEAPADAMQPVPLKETAEASPASSKKTAASKVVAGKSSGKFAVQVAAYYDKPQAEALATKLRGRGYPVHVDGEVAPFRVRIGHYATHAQAATALSNLKAKKITGFVTQE